MWQWHGALVQHFRGDHEKYIFISEMLSQSVPMYIMKRNVWVVAVFVNVMVYAIEGVELRQFVMCMLYVGIYIIN